MLAIMALKRCQEVVASESQDTTPPPHLHDRREASAPAAENLTSTPLRSERGRLETQAQGMPSVV